MFSRPEPQAQKVAPIIHIIDPVKLRVPNDAEKSTMFEWLRRCQAPQPAALTIVSEDNTIVHDFQTRFGAFVEDLFSKLDDNKTGYMCVDKALKISYGIVEGSFPKSCTDDRRLIIQHASKITEPIESKEASGITCMTAARKRGFKNASNGLRAYVFLHPSVAWSPVMVQAIAGNLHTVGVLNGAGVLQESIIMQRMKLTANCNMSRSMVFHSIMCGNLYTEFLGGQMRSVAGGSQAGGSQQQPSHTVKRKVPENLQDTNEPSKMHRQSLDESALGDECPPTRTMTPTPLAFEVDNLTPFQTDQTIQTLQNEATIRSMAKKTSELQAELERAKKAQEKAEKMLDEEKAGRRRDIEAFKVTLAALLRN